MDRRLPVEILPQPDDFTCGATCLHALYRYYGDELPLQQVIDEVQHLEAGGTLAVLLGCHALGRGYRATMYVYNLQVFDPTWFDKGADHLSRKVREQMTFKDDPKLRTASEGFLEFLHLGGEIRFEDLTRQLIRSHLNRNAPILAGLSSTYLYRHPREYGPKSDADDVRGEPAGHFVLLSGYQKEDRTVSVADPLSSNPYSESRTYDVDIDRLVCSILLGTLTYDANLLVIQPKPAKRKPRVDPHRRQ